VTNFYSAVISLMGLSASSQGAAGVVYMLCKMGEANATTGAYTGNPFSALKSAIVVSGGRSMAFQDGVEPLLTSWEMKFGR
jgi:hypothetical protein